MADFTNINGVYVKDAKLWQDIEYIRNAIGYDDILGLRFNFDTGVATRVAGAKGKTAGTDFDSFPMYGGRRLCNLADDGTVNAYYGDVGYTEDGSNGQVMIEQPKFYYRFVPLQLQEIVHQLGETTTAIANNDTTNPITIDGEEVTAATDDVATYNSSNFRWDGSKWTTVGADACGYHIVEGMWLISSEGKPGFKLHPAFYNEAGKPVSKIYLSTYEGSIYDVSESKYLKYDSWDVTENGDDTYTINNYKGNAADFNNDKLSSIAGVKPTSGEGNTLNRVNSEKLANNRGAGWHIDTVYSVSLEQLLFIIEYCSFDGQSSLSSGVVNYDTPSHNDSVFTGSTSDIGNGTGVANSTSRLKAGATSYQTSTTPGYVSIRYRGRENDWGNMWKFAFNFVTTYIDAKVSAVKINSLLSPNEWTTLNITLEPTTENGLQPKYFGYDKSYDWLFIPTKGVSSSTSIPDIYYVSSNPRTPNSYYRYGQAWFTKQKGGLFANNHYNEYTFTSYTTGARLIYIPQSV